MKKVVSRLVDKDTVNNAVFANRHVIRHDFIGETLGADDFQEFQRIVNERRPYRPSDFVPQYFIPDLSNL
ncbi:MAG: hypothetical protein II453_11200 [Alphaproteobacteria bacterium]|nr:hypothetical protein [Alphaproteobacteria bacterium]